MSKIKFNKRRKVHSYTQINNSVAENSTLSWKAKGILLYMMSRPDGWEMNKTDLINRATDKEVSVDNGLKELKQNKYLYIRKYRNEKGHFEGWEWIYDDEPFDLETPEPAPTKDLDRNPQNIVFGEKTDSPKPIKHRNRENTEIGKKGVYNNKEFLNKKDLKTKRIDDDKTKRVSLLLTADDIDSINKRVKEEYITAGALETRSINPIIRKLDRKLKAGEIKRDYEEYLRTCLDNKIVELEERRKKEAAAKAAQPPNVYTRSSRSNKRKEIVPEWVEEQKQAAKQKKSADDVTATEAERAALEKEFQEMYKR
jgi:hypothetical protein